MDEFYEIDYNDNFEIIDSNFTFEYFYKILEYFYKTNELINLYNCNLEKYYKIKTLFYSTLFIFKLYNFIP